MKRKSNKIEKCSEVFVLQTDIEKYLKEQLFDGLELIEKLPGELNEVVNEIIHAYSEAFAESAVNKAGDYETLSYLYYCVDLSLIEFYGRKNLKNFTGFLKWKTTKPKKHIVFKDSGDWSIE